MIDLIEALDALEKKGTMTAAADYLRTSQSTVSKRIAQLEAQFGRALIEPAGRKVRISPAGTRLLRRLRPLLSELRAALREESPVFQDKVILGVTESILASFGPRALRRVRESAPELKLIVNAHRNPMVIDRVRSGMYMLALCVGVKEFIHDLHSEVLAEETMVIVPSGLEPFRISKSKSLRVIAIEPSSNTWYWLRRNFERFQNRTGIKIVPQTTLQSFSGIVQMARAGFGHGLVPLNLALAMGVPEDNIMRLPKPGLTRPICLIGRESTFEGAAAARFAGLLRKTAKEFIR